MNERVDGADGLFSAGIVPETDWLALAPAAAGVGRYMLDLDNGIAQIDLTLRRMTGLDALPAEFDVDRFIGAVHPDDREMLRDAIARSAVDGSDYHATYRFLRPGDGRTVWLDARGQTVSGGSSRNLLIGTINDITELRRAQDRAELLAGEMAHRIKNVFALVQSMFNMAARSAATKEELVEAFDGRLRALVAVNALTFAGEDRVVPLADLTRSLLGPLIDAGRIRAEPVADFTLSGTAAQTMTLLLNELMTNASKYGALRPSGGSVELSTTLDGETFRIDWRETSVEPVAPPAGRGGFGMRVLRDMTRATHHGTPEIDWRPEGLSFRCTWPVEGFGHRPGSRYAGDVMDDALAAASRAADD